LVLLNRVTVAYPLQSSDFGGVMRLANLVIVEYNLPTVITPLLRAGGDCEKIILSPPPRYMKRCCKYRGHLVNKKEENYAAEMGEALAEMRDSMKDLIFGEKIRNFKALSTTRLFMEDEETAADKLREFWKDNALHMTAEGYEELVTAITNVISSAKFNQPVQGGGARANLSTAGGSGSVRTSLWPTGDTTTAGRLPEISWCPRTASCPQRPWRSQTESGPRRWEVESPKQGQQYYKVKKY
jgi:hypothetical protein